MFYGACGQFSCIYYNINVAETVTAQGRSLNSSAGMLLESFLSNNVKFGSLNEVITFIDNVTTEERIYDDRIILDSDITLQEAFYKVMMTCGFEWIPTEEDLYAVWEIMMRLSQTDLNRLYYKNNLYSFIDDNKTIESAVIRLLTMMDKPYLDPNSVPKEIEVEIEEFWQLLKEYVYYGYHTIDRVDRMENMIRNVTAVLDTDSQIVSLDPWYRFILNKIENIPMKIKVNVNPTEFVTGDEYGNNETIEVSPTTETVQDYDFYMEDVIERDRVINPDIVIAQDSLRYSIINIIAYCIDMAINDFMYKYTKNSNSASDDRKCLIIMKNEFLFKRMLITGKKHYATIQELQEGNIVNKEKQLDIKGIESLVKTTVNESTRKALKKIMYEDILNTPKIDQVKILKSLALVEKEIYNSLLSGEKKYYKPLTIKSISSYENPMSIQGIKASVIYNELKDLDDEAIDLNARNGIDIVKVNITEKNIEKIKETYPDKYNKLKVLFGGKVDAGQEQPLNYYPNDYWKGIVSIDAIAIPINVETPKWILEFINYSKIISDNISNFPLESIGLHFAGDNVNYTNILKI